jgi:Domain of unknown function (DUF1707)/Cell wall-active antibiotics response 4TMS YvqF
VPPSDSPPPETRLARRRVHETRERVITALQEHFAHDALDVDEFERRVTLAHTASTTVELEGLLGDLPALASGLVPMLPTPKAALVPAADVRPAQTVYALMSSTLRRGPWVVPRKIRVRATMSSTVLDFRDARLPAGPIDVDIRAIMSSTEIIVPPGLAVDTAGVAIMGSFEHVDRAPADPDPEAPLLRIHGLALMSSVEIKMRLPGESERDAHRRLKDERRGRKALPGR